MRGDELSNDVSNLVRLTVLVACFLNFQVHLV